MKKEFVMNYQHKKETSMFNRISRASEKVMPFERYYELRRIMRDVRIDVGYDEFDSMTFKLIIKKCKLKGFIFTNEEVGKIGGGLKDESYSIDVYKCTDLTREDMNELVNVHSGSCWRSGGMYEDSRMTFLNSDNPCALVAESEGEIVGRLWIIGDNESHLFFNPYMEGIAGLENIAEDVWKNIVKSIYKLDSLYDGLYSRNGEIYVNEGSFSDSNMSFTIGRKTVNEHDTRVKLYRRLLNAYNNGLFSRPIFNDLTHAINFTNINELTWVYTTIESMGY